MMHALENVHIASDMNMIDLRMPVQTVLRPSREFRGFAGTIASGIIRPGDTVAVLPSGKESKVKSIVTYDGETTYFEREYCTGELVVNFEVLGGETLSGPELNSAYCDLRDPDTNAFIHRGFLASHPNPEYIDVPYGRSSLIGPVGQCYNIRAMAMVAGTREVDQAPGQLSLVLGQPSTSLTPDMDTPHPGPTISMAR